MFNPKTVRAHQRLFLKQVKARTEPIMYLVEGVAVKVNPGVFPPATDSRLLAANIQIVLGQRILDLTTGCGVFSVIAGLQGASGIAVDINPQAVKNAEENFRDYGINIRALWSDMFNNVPKERFDQIFVNGPFFEGKIKHPLDYACYGARVFIERLFAQVRTHLRSDGKGLIVLSEWSDLKHFDVTIAKNRLMSKLIGVRNSDDQQRKYRLYEFTIND